jgi:tRNA(Leu) C34 or U34 (ribose-2'-O)-methylase TrmL
MNTPLPLIKIEVESMRQAMVHAFSQQMLQMDEMFKHAINEACRPERVKFIIEEAAMKYTKEAMDVEVKNYLLYGEGRRAIAQRVKERLDEDYDLTTKQ